jgi:enoyl-CoA hydratase/carnithine racemase
MGHSDDITVRIDGAIARIGLNRPDRANAYRRATLAAIDEHLESVAGRPDVRVVIVESAHGGAFCSGADLDELDGRSPQDALRLYSLEVFDRLASCPKPTIAAIDGPAVAGGLELALACDLRIATARSRFAMPEPSLGLIPAAGGTFRLPRVVGEAVAKQLILFGAELDADRALACGLIHEIVEDLDDGVRRWAARVCAADPLALELAKGAVAVARNEEDCRQVTRNAQALLYERRHGSNRGAS